MIRVAVAGCAGRMGSAVVDAVTAAEDMEIVCGIDPHASGKADAFPVFATVTEALDAVEADVLVDFTQPAVVAATWPWRCHGAWTASWAPRAWPPPP